MAAQITVIEMVVYLFYIFYFFVGTFKKPQF
jgi:hypothetical protein